MASGNGSDEDRNLVLRSQDLEWIDDVSGFRCVGCRNVLLRHNIANCGHKFCPNCKKVLDDGSKNHRCPLPECKKIIEKIHLEDSYFEETVYELRAYCPNHKHGCPFKGPLSDVEVHLKKCEDIKKKEDPGDNKNEQNKADDSFTLNELRKLSERIETMSSALNEMQQWMREMKEERVARDRKWAEIENKWAEVDQRTNSMVSGLQEVSTRLDKFTESENQLLKTEMKQIATQFTKEISALKTKLKENREKKRQEEAPKTEPEVNNTFVKPEIELLRRVSEYYEEKPDFTWIVNRIESLLSGSQKQLLSDVFPLTAYPFGVEAQLTLTGYGTVNVSLTFKDVNKTAGSTQLIEVKPFPKIYVTLKDQFNSTEREDLVMTCDFTHSHKFHYSSTFHFVSFDTKRLSSNVYNAEGKTLLDFHVESPEVASSVHSTDGTLTWAINHHRKKKQIEKDGLVEYHLSPYFYTHPQGYRVQAKAYLNGCFKYEGKGVSLSIAFLNGAYDEEQLDKNYPHKTTVTLFHPQQPMRNVSQSVEKENVSWYQINVGTPTEIENLVHEDTLYYKVLIEPIRR